MLLLFRDPISILIKEYAHKIAVITEKLIFNYRYRCFFAAPWQKYYRYLRR